MIDFFRASGIRAEYEVVSLFSYFPNPSVNRGYLLCQPSGAFVMGLPFLMFWIVSWVIVTALVMLLINILDNKNTKETS